MGFGLGGIIKSVAGPLIGGVLGASSAKSTNQANAEQAEASRLFTKEQMQNRHQWEVDDLKKAGLNPVLSAGGTPSIGGSAQAQMIDPMQSAMTAANSAMALRKMSEEVNLLREQKNNVRADTGLKKQAERIKDPVEDVMRGTSQFTQGITNSAKSVKPWFDKSPLKYSNYKKQWQNVFNSFKKKGK